MPRFNPDKIAKLFSEMRTATARLQALKALDRDSFLKDADKIGSAKYHFIVAIESAIDVCSHIISQNGYRAPEDYADAFRVLEEQSALSPDFLNDLINMAKFRNRLTHLYWEVDDEQLYEILQTRLGDFKIFIDQIGLFLHLDKL